MSKNNKKYRYKVWYYTNRLANNLYKLKCIGDMNINTLKRKKHILNHCYKYGINSTIDAFHISQSCIYNYKREEKLGLLNENKSTKPKSVRKSKTDPKIRDYIIELREKH
jgi:hypothetical protein